MSNIGPPLPRRRNACGLLALVALAAAAIVVASAGDAFARAGGGQGYHGSGSSHSGGVHSGSGGGGGDIGPLLYWGFQFVVHYPYIGLPLIALAIYLCYKASQQGTDTYRTSVIRRAVGQTAELNRAAAIERLRAGDAAFDEAGFCARAQQAFLKLQQAWSAQDLAPVRPFVSDGIFERFSLQVAEQRDFNYRNQVDRVEVAEVRLVQVAGDSIFDLLTVGIRAKADDYRVALDTGKRLRDGAESNEFVEYWTFLRRHGVSTGDRPGLVEGQCPNCGAQIELNESAKCASCGSLVRSGNFDWVLVEITQSAEWNDEAPAEPPGVAEFRAQRDPGFNVEHLEDRTSVIFWRKAMADRLGDTKPLLKMALPEFCQTYPQRWGPDKSLRRYWGDAAVGSVETLGVLPGEPHASDAHAGESHASDTHDRALVEVRWAGRTFTAQPGKQPAPAGENALFRTLYVLHRRTGVKSDVAASVTSAHCPSCGAPEGDVTASACEFCGAVLNDGSHDWVLGDMFPIPGEEAAALVDELDRQAAGAEPAPEGAGDTGEPAPSAASDDGTDGDGADVPRSGELLAWAVQMALADQVLSDKERRALERAAMRRGVPPARLETMIEAAQRGQLVVPQPRDADEGRKWLSAMTDMALADGRIEPAEASLLWQTGQQLGWSRADVQQLVATRKARLYQAAREQLKNRRNGANGSGGTAAGNS
jgi:uncharacterized tellurite resistance protein B-like protein